MMIFIITIKMMILNDDGRYDSWMEKVPELHDGYHFEISRFVWDQSPTYGTWADLNVWDSYLEDDDLAAYSDCKNVVRRRGNVINEDMVWDITGSIIKQVKEKT